MFWLRLRDYLLRPSVRIKIMGIVLALVLLLGFGVTWQVRVTMTDALLVQLQERGVSIARDIAARSTDYILINHTYALHELLQDSLRNNADLRYAFILDANNRVLVHTFENGMPRGLVEKNSVAPTARAHSVVLYSDEGVIHDIAAPIFEGRIGTARVGLTEDSVHRAVDALTRQMLLTTLGVSILGIGAAYLLTLILTRPILALVRATESIARGDLTVRVPPWGEDEIGKLATAFNRMTAELAHSQRAMQQRHRELAALNAIANAVNTPAPLNETLARALRLLLAQLGLPAGWVFLLEPSDRSVRLVAWQGLPLELGEREIVAFRECPCQNALLEKRSIVISAPPPHCPLREGRLSNGRTIAAHVTVPIFAREQIVGVIGIASADANAFDADEVRLLEAVGQQLGVVIENARLWEDLREKERVRGQLLEQVLRAQEEERKRIARELHDDTGQALTSLMVGLRAASDACESATRARLESLRDIAAQTLNAVKRLARELRPPLLDDLGLPAALERYLASYRTTFHLNTDLQVAGFGTNGRLAPEIELALYRIVQEALTNVAKHAQARNVSVVVERKARSVIAIIEDDGKGFDVHAVMEAGRESQLGLYGMRERAELLGGRLHIESAPSQGTSVFVEVPTDD
ncbi:MAG: GAF domain-containing protein [Anaerolineae bacterium]|nr:GAF domain-containing protein [Anaerolineae bacterium]